MAQQLGFPVDAEHAVMTRAEQGILSLVVHNGAGEVSADLRIRDQFALRRADGNAGILVSGIAEEQRACLLQR